MLIKYTDVTGQVVWTPAGRVIAITIPSPVALHGDGKCRIVLEGGVVSEISRTEAERFLAAINEGTK